VSAEDRVPDRGSTALAGVKKPVASPVSCWWELFYARSARHEGTYGIRARAHSEGIRSRDSLVNQAGIIVIVADLHGPIPAEALFQRRVRLSTRKNLDW
jgi:hypothetical protein